MKSYFSAIIDIIYPPHCQICELRILPKENILCLKCFSKIKKNKPPFCISCGKSMIEVKENQNQLCWECEDEKFYFERAWSATLYEGIIKKCIHLIKFKSKSELIKPLSKLLVNFSKSFLNIEKFDLLIPVPIHSRKMWIRQFNQSSLLAKTLSKEFNIVLSENNLIKHRNTLPQSKLMRRERLTNLKDAFKIRKSGEVNKKNVLLVDDVFTTGSTVSECAKLLKDNGAKYIEVLTLARGV